jgi:5-methylcytosine-specific restriction protein A
MTGRAVAEWVGRTPDSKVPTSVRTRVFLAHGGICHISGQRITVGQPWELEHVKPLSMGGEHREANLAPALVLAHREKTAAEAGDRAKADRIRAKHIGAWPASKRPLQSRPFEPSRSSFARGNIR